MARIRVSTTVDEDLWAEARAAHGPGTDASVLEAALRDYLRAHHRAEIDTAYAAAYAERPWDISDAWGDVADWQGRIAAARATER